MDIVYQNSLHADFMTVSGPPLTPDDLFQLKMLLTNRIPGLISFRIDCLCDGTEYCYDITSLMPFEEYCRTKNPGYADIVRIYRKIFDTIALIDDYLLDPDHLCLEKEALHIGWGNAGLMLAYIPAWRRDIRESLLSFCEFMLKETGSQDENCMILNARMLHELHRKNSSLEDLYDILHRSAPAFEGDIRSSIKDELSTPVRKAEPSMKTEPSAENDPSGFVPVYASGSAGDSAFSENVPSPDDPDSARLFEEDTEKKRALLPERSAFKSALIAAVPALVLYFVLHMQNLFVLNTSETVGAALLAAAAVLAVMIAVDRVRERRHFQDREADAAMNPADGRSPGFMRRHTPQ